jgi:hypothetical protein
MKMARIDFDYFAKKGNVIRNMEKEMKFHRTETDFSARKVDFSLVTNTNFCFRVVVVLPNHAPNPR